MCDDAQVMSLGAVPGAGFSTICVMRPAASMATELLADSRSTGNRLRLRLT